MKLRDLDAVLIRSTSRVGSVKVVKPGIDPQRGNWTEDDFITVERMQHSWNEVDSIAEAHGIQFNCPKCSDGERGHIVICWSRSAGAPEDIPPLPGRWSLHGTSIYDLTLDGDVGNANSNRSVQLQGGCNAHFHVTNGEIVPA